MTLFDSSNFSSDILYVYVRDGSVDNPYVDITENITVSQDRAFLKEVPQKYSRVIVKNNTTTMNEVERKEDVLTVNDFFVDYREGVVYLHNTLNGNKNLSFKYKGTGAILYPASRIYINGDNTGVNETLQDIIDISNSAIEGAEGAIEDLKDAVVAEGDRVASETIRKSNEATRVSSEATRVTDENTRKTNETARVSAETSRASAETTRNTNENTRKTSETARGTAETGRVNAETSRVSVEATRVTDENTRKSNETARGTAEATRVTNETSRGTAETARVSAESSRVTVEGTRVTAENTRKTNETARGTAETARASAETTRGTNETARVNDETTRISSENTRNTNEGNRTTAETARATAEGTRVTAETARASAETTRASSESTRVTNENTRKTDETARGTAENTRKTNETARGTAETARATAESTRATSESTRITDENTRKSNEATRVQSETDRQSTFSTTIQNAQNATNGANSSAQLAQAVADNTIHKGEYNSATTYLVNNVVSYNYSSYMCISQSKGNLPTNSIYFRPLAMKGADGTGSVDSVNGKGGVVILNADDVGAYSKSETDNKIAGIVNSAPSTLDTLKELANALGDDPNFATTIATQIGTKVDKVTGKQLSTEDYTTAEKTKLSGVATGANNYVHPANHPPSIIVQDASNRFVTDAEKTTWNAKASTAVATTTVNGLQSSADKTKLDGISTGANNYTHPATHPPSIIVQDASNRFVTDAEKTTWNAKASTAIATTSTNGLMSSADKTKSDGISTGANKVLNHANNGSISVDGVEQVVYVHPANHPASMITQDANNRFVTDVQKNKLDELTSTISIEEFTASANQTIFDLSKAYIKDKNRLRVIVGGVEQFPVLNFAETSTTSFTLSEGVPQGMKIVSICLI